LICGKLIPNILLAVSLFKTLHTQEPHYNPLLVGEAIRLAFMMGNASRKRTSKNLNMLLEDRQNMLKGAVKQLEDL